MKHLRTLVFATAAVLCTTGCTSSTEEKLIGAWEATDVRGNATTLIIGKDHTLQMVAGNSVHGDGNGGANVTWKLDERSEPMRLNVSVRDSQGTLDRESIMLIKLISDDLLQLRAVSPREDNPQFQTKGDGDEQLIFSRRPTHDS